MSTAYRRTDKTRADAQELRDRLKAEGRAYDAEIVTRLIAASKTGSTVNAQLWEDNRQLREQLK